MKSATNNDISSFIKAYGLEGKRDLLRSQEQGVSMALGALGWHNPSDIETLIGLGGSYLWTEAPFSPAWMTFTFGPGEQGTAGTYTLRGLSQEQGTFVCVPNNPAIGSAFIALNPSSGPSRVFMVQGMTTGNDWKIFVLALSKITDNTVFPPFWNTRISL